MQSVQNTAFLEKERKDKEQQLLIVWRESDTQKAKAVQALAETLEKWYISQNMHEMVKEISIEITSFLRESGATNVHHVPDYLHEKYKHNKVLEDHPEDGMNAAKIDIEEYYSRNPLNFDHPLKIDIVQELINREKRRDQEAEREKHLKEAILQAATIQKQAMNFAQDSFSSSTDKNYESTHTDIPYFNYDGDVYEMWKDYEAAVKRYYDTVKSIKDDWYNWGKFESPAEKEQERALARAIAIETEYFNTWNEIHSPFKDLKYAVSQKGWFNILEKFLHHGKHAAAVMDPIICHDDPNTKRTLTREEVGDEVFQKEQLLEKWAYHRDYSAQLSGEQLQMESTLIEIRRDFICNIVRAYATDPYLCNHVKSWFTNHPLRIYDRDEEIIIPLRKEYVGKLKNMHTNTGGYWDQSSDFRDARMGERVASRRKGAHDTLSGLA